MNKKYDVFISSKSEDYHYAEDVYNFLTSNGFITFFANKELDKIGEAEYADAIDAALDATTHMIVVASSPKYVKSKWVHYEWSTFRNDLNSDYREGNLLTILIGIEPKSLPAGLRHQQSFKYESFTDGRILGYLHKKSIKIVPQSSTGISSSTSEMTENNNKSADVLQSLGLSQKARESKKKYLFSFELDTLVDDAEVHWETFIEAILNKQVIPVIGPDIVRVGNNSFIQGFLTQISKSLGIEDNYITSFDQLIFDVKFNKYRYNVHSIIARSLDEYGDYVKDEVSCDIMSRLLSTHLFPFVLTTTVDGMLESIMRKKYGNNLSVLVFDNDPIHIKKNGDIRMDDDINKPTLYYMYGKASPTNRFVLTEDDLRSFSKSWLSEEISPRYIRHALHNRYLLFLGYDYKNGIDSFFLQDLRLSGDSITRPKPIYEFIQKIEKGIQENPDIVVNEIIRRIEEKTKEIEKNKFDKPQQDFDVYISYSRSDSKIAEILYESLTRLGLQVWFDKHNLSRNGNYMDDIRKAIQTAKYFVPILTQNITKDRNEAHVYRYEWDKAIDQAMCYGRAFIIPIAEEGFDFYESNIPEEMQRINAIYFSEESSFEGIAEKIVQIINRN